MSTREPLSKREPEPWLREITLPCDPAIAAVVFALRQAEEDLARFEAPPSVNFHLRHIAGSLDRLTAYLKNQALTDAQLAALASEQTGGAESREELLAALTRVFANTRETLLRFPAVEFGEPRYVGRRRIRTTAIGLIIHMAEHTQRHVGQVIAYSRTYVKND